MGRKSTVNLPEEEVVEKYKNGESMVKLANFYEVKTHHIDWILRKHGVEKRKNQINSRRYSFNENFFEKIDTEEKSYWLGFMAADGFVQTRGNTFGISLSSVDKSHLEKFNKSLESNYPIHDYLSDAAYKKNTPYSRLLLTSEKAKSDLIRNGIVENKTLVLSFPEIEKNLINHYIRGYFDGDGSLSAYKKQYQFKVVGTKEFLNSIFLHIGFRGKDLYRRHYNEKNTYYISIGGNNQVEKIMDFLYEDATIYLDRKFLKYQEFKHSRPE